MKRSLVLRRETLAELSAGDLAHVVGAQYSSPGAPSCGVTACVTIVTDMVDIRIDTDTNSYTCPTVFCSEVR